MKKEQKQNQKIDQILENYYSYIGYHHVNNWAEEFDEIKKAAEEIEYPQALHDRFEQYMNEYKKREQKAKWIARMKKFSKRIAVFLLILGTTVAFLSVSIDAFRVKTLNFIMNVTEKYSSIHLEEMYDREDSLIDLSDWTSYYVPTYYTI